ncbi:MAG: GNAT family N-acetyltransferase [Christensenellaceae bacterium]|nr:GNAT family N-acetyltransferase [Christensenellaceae bacterium]
MPSTTTFRFATPQDIPAIHGFICGLAAYEHLEDEVVATPALLTEWLFEKQKAEALLAEIEGQTVGFALFFYSFSTFLGRACIHLEDLFVLPQYRGLGCGKALLRELASITLQRGCGRLEWSCLDWNAPSIAFYRGVGAVPLEDWTNYRLSGDALRAFAEEG